MSRHFSAVGDHEMSKNHPIITSNFLQLDTVLAALNTNFSFFSKAPCAVALEFILVHTTGKDLLIKKMV